MNNEILDVSTEEKMKHEKDFFLSVIKKLAMLDKMNIHWIPYKYDYYYCDDYMAQVMLPNDNLIIKFLIKTPKFDDGKIICKESTLCKIAEENHFRRYGGIAKVFEKLKRRHEKGVDLFQDYEYEALYESDFRYKRAYKKRTK